MEVIVIDKNSNSQSETNVEYIENITRLTLQNDMERLRKELKKNPNNKSHILKYARTCFSLGNFNEAEKLAYPFVDGKMIDPEAILLIAEINYVKGEYSKSQIFYNSLLKDYKETYGLQAEAGLQKVYYQTKQFYRAKELFEDLKDLENPILDMMKEFGERKPYSIDWYNEITTTIPFKKSSVGVYISIKVNGIKMNAFVDTGADALVIDQEKANELGIKSISEMEGLFAGGKTSKIGFGRTDKLRIGEVDISNLPTMIASFESWKKNPDFLKVGNIHAVIGTNVLKQFISTIDFPERQLTLDQRSEDGRVNMNERYKECQMNLKVPFTLSGTHYIHGKGTINEHQDLNIFADSGFINVSDQGINLSKGTLEFLNFPIPKLEKSKIAGLGGGDFEVGELDLDSYGFEKLKIHKVHGLYETGNVLMYMFRSTGFVTDAMIGENYLKQYKWTLDFDEMVMSFRK